MKISKLQSEALSGRDRGNSRKPQCTDLKSKAQQVNWNAVFPGKVLQRPSEEGLGEEEAREPEHVGLILVIPVLQAHKIKTESDGRVIVK